MNAGTIDVVVPQAVLGEAVAVVMRERPGDSVALVGEMLGEIRDLVDPRGHMPSTTAKIAGLATNLSNAMGVEFTDALILSHALCDPHATHLITKIKSCSRTRSKPLKRRCETVMRAQGGCQYPIAFFIGDRRRSASTFSVCSLGYDLLIHATWSARLSADLCCGLMSIRVVATSSYWSLRPATVLRKSSCLNCSGMASPDSASYKAG